MPIKILSRDEFESQWEKHMDDERQFVHDFLAGKFADSVQPEGAEGAPMEMLVDRADEEVIVHEELNRLCCAVIAWRAAHDLGDALRHVKGGCYLATQNVGFEFESDFFRLASYDWSEDEDENGDIIIRHNFVCKPAGNHLDWYKWAGRDDWASKGLVAAFEAAQRMNIPLYAWWERVVDACIESLLMTETATFHRLESCGWRHLDEAAIPHRMVKVDATIESPEVDSVTLRHPDEGYVGFKVSKERGTALPSDIEDVTDGHAALARLLMEAVGRSKERPLAQSISLDKVDCPDDVGYVVVGDRVFRRLVLDRPRMAIPTEEEPEALGDEPWDGD